MKRTHVRSGFLDGQTDGLRLLTHGRLLMEMVMEIREKNNNIGLRRPNYSTIDKADMTTIIIYSQ